MLNHKAVVWEERMKEHDMGYYKGVAIELYDNNPTCDLSVVHCVVCGKRVFKISNRILCARSATCKVRFDLMVSGQIDRPRWDPAFDILWNCQPILKAIEIRKKRLLLNNVSYKREVERGKLKYRLSKTFLENNFIGTKSRKCNEIIRMAKMLKDNQSITEIIK